MFRSSEQLRTKLIKIQNFTAVIVIKKLKLKRKLLEILLIKLAYQN